MAKPTEAGTESTISHATISLGWKGSGSAVSPYLMAKEASSVRPVSSAASSGDACARVVAGRYYKGQQTSTTLIRFLDSWRSCRSCDYTCTTPVNSSGRGPFDVRSVFTLKGLA